MPKLTIDGIDVVVEEGSTVIQACEKLGIEVPRFCYHSRLAIAGNCRMCLVEVEKSPKPVASCALPATENMVVHTNTPMVKKAREGVMEFLLINHPLDCPICDQAGECDLQDQAMAYGKGSSRYTEEKRAVKHKDFGPLIKTEMTRCIHCTRCVRFINEIAGVPEIGAIYRGENMEIVTLLEKSVSSELSGNVIDLCPVGALTSKPYAFKARSWELQKCESIDVMDAVGSNIRIDSRGLAVMRILPRLNEDINEEWISDKTRFACDGLTKQRLDSPYIKKEGKLVKSTWEDTYKLIASKIKSIQPDEMAAIAGDLVDVESMFALKNLFNLLGSYNTDCRQYNEKLDNKHRSDYLFNTSIAGIEEADYCLIIGANPRVEASILNARIRKAFLKGLKIALIGTKVDLTYDYEYLGDDIKTLEEILLKKHPVSELLTNARKPMVILGTQAISRKDGAEIINLTKLIAEKYGFVSEDWNGFNILHTAASRVGGLDIGFIPKNPAQDVDYFLEGASAGKIKLLYLLGADEIDFTNNNNCLVIYQGHHGDKGAHVADIILPGSAYTEKDASYVNLEGRVQRTYTSVKAPGDAKLDWQIIIEIAQMLKITLHFKDLQSLRAKMFAEFPHFANIDLIAKSSFIINKREYNYINEPIAYKRNNYYLTNPICRASVTMAKIADVIAKGESTCKC